MSCKESFACSINILAASYRVEHSLTGSPIPTRSMLGGVGGLSERLHVCDRARSRVQCNLTLNLFVTLGGEWRGDLGQAARPIQS